MATVAAAICLRRRSVGARCTSWAPAWLAIATPTLAIGDWVVLGAAKHLAGAGFGVDVHGCRQMGEGLRVMAARRRAGTLPSVVVVALGSNWVISSAEIHRALHIVGRHRLLG